MAQVIRQPTSISDPAQLGYFTRLSGIKRISVALCGMGDTTTAKTAFDLGQQLGASVTGYFVAETVDVYAFSGMATPYAPTAAFVVETMTELNRDRSENAHRAFDLAAKAYRPPFTMPADSVAAHWAGDVDGAVALDPLIRLTDLVIVAQPTAARGSSPMAVFDSVLFRARRSVLIVPESSNGLSLNTVLVAFNGSAEAARAVTKALPILAQAKTVKIVCLGKSADQSPTPDDLVAYLRGHGIAAQIVAITEHDKSECALMRMGGVAQSNAQTKPEEVLMCVAHAERADLLVMGAYTHSHLRQMVLGGLTRHVLEHSTIPVLMAH